jgi:hypothetical protein
MLESLPYGGADCGLLMHGVANPHGPDLADQPGKEELEDSLLHEDPCSVGADLPLAQVVGHQCSLHTSI